MLRASVVKKFNLASYCYFVKSMRGVCEINFADNWFRDKSRNPGSGARDSSRALSDRNLFRRKKNYYHFRSPRFSTMTA